jgi:predicted transposase YbfD/YdcC
VADERRSSISSLGLGAQQMAERVRGHGALEHALHGGLAIACREDDRRLRTGHAPEHGARRRPIALNLRKPEQTNRPGMKVQRARAGWENDDVLTGLGR